MVIVAMIFALPAINPTVLGTEASATVVVVTGNGVRLRYAPSLNSAVYKCVSKGKELTYRYTTADRNWYCVNYHGYDLFISRDFAVLRNSSSSSHSSYSRSSSSAYSYVKVTGNGVRLRYGPGLGYDVYTQVNKGTKLPLYSTQGDWYCVIYGGRYLYVSRDFASLSH